MHTDAARRRRRRARRCRAASGTAASPRSSTPTATPTRALDARADALAAGCLHGADEADARFYLGARLQRAGHLARAAAEYDRVLALRPDDPRARTNRAWALLPSELARALVLRPSVLAGAMR